MIYEPPTVFAVTNATNKTAQRKGNKTFILHNLTRIQKISCEKIKTFKPITAGHCSIFGLCKFKGQAMQWLRLE
jgi:hypothetical protein